MRRIKNALHAGKQSGEQQCKQDHLNTDTVQVLAFCAFILLFMVYVMIWGTRWV